MTAKDIRVGKDQPIRTGTAQHARKRIVGQQAGIDCDAATRAVRVRTVVVPPSLNKTFWVTRDQASNEYLEQMGSFIAWLVLDVTPASIDWKKDILLGYVEPDQYGPLKTRQEVEAERLKRINAATVFAPQQLVPSEEGQSVVIRGRLRTLVNGFETANDLKAYRVEFSYAGARMHLKSFKEVPNAGN